MIYTTDERSIYYYDDVPVLINNFNIKEQALLTSIETDITLNRISELSVKPIKGRFTLSHLSNIHKYIFGDIYPFAGKTRDENLVKGDTRFCSCEYIKECFDVMYNSLKEENYLKGLNVDEFCYRLAYYMSEINMIHPFREGNGRTIREYIRILAKTRGFVINWKVVDGDALLDATIFSVRKGYEDLAKCIYQSIKG